MGGPWKPQEVPGGSWTLLGTWAVQVGPLTRPSTILLRPPGDSWGGHWRSLEAPGGPLQTPGSHQRPFEAVEAIWRLWMLRGTCSSVWGMGMPFRAVQRRRASMGASRNVPHVSISRFVQA